MSSNRGPASPKTIGQLAGSIHSLQMIKAWKECAGPALGAQVVFLGIQQIEGEQVLSLEVRDPLWRQELEYQKASILSAYSKKLKEKGFSERELPQRIELLAHASLLYKNRSTSKRP